MFLSSPLAAAIFAALNLCSTFPSSVPGMFLLVILETERLSVYYCSPLTLLSHMKSTHWHEGPTFRRLLKGSSTFYVPLLLVRENFDCNI